MQFLKQSTASQSVVIGPFVDSTDGNTAETGLTIAVGDVRLSKNGANIVSKNSGGGTHDELGYYTITLNATDTNTVGRLQVMVHETGALPVYHEYQVLEEAIYDALFASAADGFDANGRVDVAAIAGTAQTANDNGADINAILVDTNSLNDTKIPDTISLAAINAQVDTALTDIHLDHLLAADYDPAAKPGTATALLNELVENDLGVSRFTTNALENGPSGGGDGSGFTAIPWNASWDAEVQSECTDALNAYDPPTRAELTSDINGLNDPTAAVIADAVWDELQSAHVTAGSFGEIATEMAAILADTNELQTDDYPTTIAALQTDLDTLTAGVALTAAGVDAIWDEALSGHTSTGTVGRALQLGGVVLAETTVSGTPADALTITLAAGSTVDDYYNDLQIVPLSGGQAGQARIIADYTGSSKLVTIDEAWTTALSAGDAIAVRAVHTHPVSQLQAGLATAAALTTVDNEIATIDSNVDAIKVKTDPMTYTKANELDANTQSINGATVVGDGNATPWDGA
jgi:hypothetical protein